MSIIVGGFHSPRQKEILDAIFSHPCADRGYLIMQDISYSPSYPGIKVLYVSDLNKCIYPEMETKAFNEDFLNYIHENFYVLMSMMNRLDSFSKRPNISAEEKRAQIYKHFSFWYTVVSEDIPKAFVASNVPHDICDYILFLTLKFFGKTKFLYFYQTNFGDIIIPYSSSDFSSDGLGEAFQATTDSTLGKLGRIEWDKEINKIQPFYMTMKINTGHTWQYRLKNVLLGKRNIFEIFVNKKNALLYNRATKRLKKEYKKLCCIPDFRKNYIYYPMHYQPELTSCPLGGHYTDQWLIIKMLDSLLPEGYYLYVKEHPKQEAAGRYKDYYQDIAKHTKRTVLVDTSVASSKLTESCKAVVTITGTAGWEALFQLKPVLLFGRNFYEYANGVFRIRNEKDCKEAIDKIVSGQVELTLEDIQRFVAASENFGIHGFIDPAYECVSALTIEESNKNLISYITNWMQSNI